MDFLSSVNLCQLLLITKVANSYVLLSADVEDLRALAKKIIPETFADHITNAILYLTLTGSSKNDDDKVKKYDDAKNSNDNNPYFKAREIPDVKGTKINFEELIAKVKNRLEKELKNKNWHNNNANKKYKTQMTNMEPDKTHSQIWYTSKSTKRKHKRNMKKTITTTTENYVEDQYPEMQPLSILDETQLLVTNVPLISKHLSKPRQKVAKIKQQNKRFKIATNKELLLPFIDDKPKANLIHKKGKRKVKSKIYPVEGSLPNMPFKETYLQTNDSYADYVTPEKESNVFASDEKKHSLLKNKETRFKIKNNAPKHPKKLLNQNMNNKDKLIRHNIMPQIVKQSVVTTLEESDTEKTIGSAEIEARTENLWLHDLEENRGSSKDWDEKAASRIATHFPIRQLYSAFTPEYVTDHTIYAEKYNFDEPLPENDRANEKIKFFGDPMSKINKKIKLF